VRKRTLFVALSGLAGAVVARAKMINLLIRIGLVAGVFTGLVGAFGAEDLAVTGRFDPRLKPFDDLMTAFVKEHQVPGAALAISYHGRLVYARGFGYADVERKAPVLPGSRFRIASVSKPLTAVAILQLVGRKKLRVEDRLLDIVHLPPHLEPGAKPDPRWKEITILHLLQHTAGFDRDKSFDPMFRPMVIARAVGVPPPAGQEAIIRYMLGRPLDFAPGERYAYSNFGYCLLGRVIESVSGQTYEAYVREHVLKPVGVEAVQVGHTSLANRLPGEVLYYGSKDEKVDSVVSPGTRVPPPYGSFYLEAMDSHGGWVASAPDLVRFAAAFDVANQSRLLSTKEIRTMFARPTGAAGLDKNGGLADAYYGCGWSVRPVGKDGRANTWHGGDLDGTQSLLVRRHDRIDWAVLFNTRKDPAGKNLVPQIDELLHTAADAVRTWPAGNLFPVATPSED
jgi:N-acyl-D-amino-acid deacylase